MPRIGLTGNTSVAAKWIGYAMQKLSDLKRSMEMRKFKQDSMRIGLADAIVNIQSGYGLDTISIKGLGGEVFELAGKVHALSSVTFSDPTLRWRVEGVDTVRGVVSSQKDFGTPSEVMPGSLNVSQIAYLDGHAFITYPKLSGAYPNIFWRILKKNTSDLTLWDQTLPGLFYGTVERITTGHDGSVYACGEVVEMLPGFGGYVTGDILPRIEKRDKDTGNLIWGVNGATPKFCSCISVDATGVYVGGFYQQVYFATWYYTWTIEKRSLIDGSLIWYQEFNTPYGGRPTQVQTSSDALYILGAQHALDQGFNPGVRLEQRSLDIGALLQSYTNTYGATHAIGASLQTNSKCAYTGVTVLDGTFALIKINKADFSVAWNVGFPQFEGVVYIGKDGNPVMTCETADGHYFWKKRSATDGLQLWRTPTSSLYGL